jgi:hypothetical protein
VQNAPFSRAPIAIISLPSDTLQKFGIWGFTKIFSKTIVIPSKEIPFFGKAPQWF